MTILTATISGSLLLPDLGQGRMVVTLEPYSDASLVTFAGMGIGGKIRVPINGDGTAAVTVPQIPQAGLLPTGAEWLATVKVGGDVRQYFFTLTANTTWDDVLDPANAVAPPGLLGEVEDARDVAVAAAAAAAVSATSSDAATLKSKDRITNIGQSANRILDLTQVTPATDIFGQAGPLITVPTGYTNNEVVEPSVLYDASAPFLGYEYVLCISPYPASDVTKENPCLWVSHDGTTWVPVVNGVATPGYGGTATPIFGDGVQGDGHNSDPYIYRGPDGTYYILWNQFLNSTGSGGTGTGSNDWGIKISKASSLAGPWSTPVAVVQSVRATTRPASPSIFWDGRIWHMYAVDIKSTTATTLMHYTNTSADASAGTWTLGTAPAATIPTAYNTQVWWHLNAYYAGGQHVLMIQDSKSGTSGGGNLWLIASNDSGTTWTVPPAPHIPSLNSSLYRGAIVFTADGGLDVFYGRIGTLWEFRRVRLMIAGPQSPTYGGVNLQGNPINALAVAAARVPIAPYVFGDVPARADSAVTPGTSDSGSAYTVSSGTVGVQSKQLYGTTVTNNRAALTTTGCANGVTTAELSAVETTGNQAYLIFRYTDASNYVRVGQAAGSTNYAMTNIVAGAVTQTLAVSTTVIVPAAGDQLAVVHNGSTISFYVNGRLAGTATGWTSNASASGVGVQLTGTLARFRNITQRSLVNGA